MLARRYFTVSSLLGLILLGTPVEAQTGALPGPGQPPAQVSHRQAQQALRAAEVAAAEANLKLALTMLARDKAAGVRGPDLDVAQARVELAKAELEVKRALHKETVARPRQASGASEALRRRVQELEKAVAELTEENAQLRQARAKTWAPPAARTEWSMFTLKHLAAADSVKIIRELLGEGKVRLVAFDRTNSVLINGTSPEAKSIEALLVRLDVPGEDAAPRIEWKMYPLKHMQATDCAKIVQELMGKGKLHVVPITRTNSVLAQGQLPDLKTIEALLMRLDVPADKPGRGRAHK
jgi:type II secretory pathway component GspD/PulD (secretin)